MTTLKSDSTRHGGTAVSSGDGTSSHPASVVSTEQISALVEQVTALREQVARLTERESELRAVLEHETLLDAQLDRLNKTLRKTTMAERVTASIERATLKLDPFPYAVVDELLPQIFYDSLLTGLPPVELFEHKPIGKQHLDLPFDMAPLYSRRVWRFMCSEMVPNVIATALTAKFRQQIDEWIGRNWPDIEPGSVELHGSGGRIMLRRRGYRIRPHRDPKWSFLTCILYLAKPGDSEAWGTQILAVDQDQEAKNAAPYWIDEKQCRVVEDVEFRANRLLVFLNSTGAHGAHIPADAQPEGLQRYIYQFRIGPTVEAIAKLRSMLPEERQPLWAGKALIDY
jgi:hypothetical protein